jgi:hypothetical protein
MASFELASRLAWASAEACSAGLRRASGTSAALTARLAGLGPAKGRVARKSLPITGADDHTHDNHTQ